MSNLLIKELLKEILLNKSLAKKVHKAINQKKLEKIMNKKNLWLTMEIPIIWIAQHKNTIHHLLVKAIQLQVDNYKKKIKWVNYKIDHLILQKINHIFPTGNLKLVQIGIHNQIIII